jgi:ATP synthase F1 complex assembly factor 1
MYPELAESHKLVLLRGEITASTSGGGWMLSQEDAQMLIMGVQKFYLWEERGGSGKDQDAERLLKAFHEKAEEFKWEELL